VLWQTGKNNFRNLWAMKHRRLAGRQSIFIERYWRRGAESNRRRRLCRPLHDHSATPPGGTNRRSTTSAAAATRRNEKGGPTQRAGAVASEKLEGETRLELATSTLARLRSTN